VPNPGAPQTGGSGVIIITEQAGVGYTSGVWSLKAQFQYKKAGNWTS
jgi:hypothetical protein